MEQGSVEWHNLRNRSIGASDSPVILGVSPWNTPYSLFLQKQGKILQKDNPNMARGRLLEEEARQLYIKMTGVFVSPDVRFSNVYDWMICSLDGISKDNSTMVEIKTANRLDHSNAEMGIIPEKYMPQLQHQMFVCELDRMHYFSFNGQAGVIVEVFRDDAFIEKMIEKEKAFYQCMVTNTPPPLCDRDYVEKTDSAWAIAALEYTAAVAEQKAAEARVEACKARLAQMADGKPCMGAGIKMSKVSRVGAVDYGKIPDLIGVDLEKYRKAGSEYWRVTSE